MKHNGANEAAAKANSVDCMDDGVMGILGIHRCFQLPDTGRYKLRIPQGLERKSRLCNN